MGNSTGSMFYMFIIIVVVYIIGISVFLGFQYLKKKIDTRRNLRFLERRNQHD